MNVEIKECEICGETPASFFPPAKGFVCENCKMVVYGFDSSVGVELVTNEDLVEMELCDEIEEIF